LVILIGQRTFVISDGEGLVCPVHRLRMGQLSILAGVIVFISSVAASFTSSPTALSTRQVSQAACKIGATYPGHQYAVSAPIFLE
jgi:hypothetical protein